MGSLVTRLLCLCAVLASLCDAASLSGLLSGVRRSVASLPFFAPSTTLEPASSSSLVAKDYADNIMTTYGRYPLTIKRGKGSRLWSTEGKEYLDCAAGIATCCLGHGHPGLARAG